MGQPASRRNIVMYDRTASARQSSVERNPELLGVLTKPGLDGTEERLRRIDGLHDAHAAGGEVRDVGGPALQPVEDVGRVEDGETARFGLFLEEREQIAARDDVEIGG